MQFTGFKKEAIEFLEELEENNNKVWFEENRYRWDKNIIDINRSFIEEMGETLQILVPTINAIPKVSKSMFKIHKDTRFSKSKIPFKNKVGMIFWQGNTHRMSSSSFYFFYTKNEYYIATGMREFKKPVLLAFREYIKNEQKAEELIEILENLKAKGYNICEQKYKRIPKEIDKEYKYSHLGLYGMLNAYKTFSIDKIFYSSDIVDFAFKIYSDMEDLHTWIYDMTLTVKE